MIVFISLQVILQENMKNYCNNLISFLLLKQIQFVKKQIHNVILMNKILNMKILNKLNKEKQVYDKTITLQFHKCFLFNKTPIKIDKKD